MFYRAINFKLWDIFTSEKKLLSSLLDKKKVATYQSSPSKTTLQNWGLSQK